MSLRATRSGWKVLKSRGGLRKVVLKKIYLVYGNTMTLVDGERCRA